MIFATKLSVVTSALVSAVFSSTVTVGHCKEDTVPNTATNTSSIVPVTSSDAMSVYLDGTVIPTQRFVVDPWIRPPRNVSTQQAIGRGGDFDEYPIILASPYDTIEFVMRPIDRRGDNTQRHGVYVITEPHFVQEYLDGTREHPCGAPVYTEAQVCQVVGYAGLNATACPSRATLFPLLEIFGNSGVIGYTVSDLGTLAEHYGVVTETGSRILSFDCPWIQGRNEEGGGRTSHCIGGMYQLVEVVSKEQLLKTASMVPVTHTKDDDDNDVNGHHSSHDNHDDNIDHADTTSGSSSLTVSMLLLCMVLVTLSSFHVV